MGREYDYDFLRKEKVTMEGGVLAAWFYGLDWVEAPRNAIT